MLPATRIPHGPFGVVLNANAGRVTPRLAHAVRRVVDPDHVFLTESKEHAEEVLRACAEREYSAVFAGGGDGTIVDAINTLTRLREEGARVPAIGVLRLGTGNALAHWLGSGRPVRDLQRYSDRAPHVSRSIRMVTSDGTLFPFGGAGHDAAVLNDYYAVKSRFKDTALAGLCSGMTGYLIAAFGRTVPAYLSRPNPTVRVINIGRPAWRVGPGGDETGEAIPTGGVLYEGPAAAVGAATTPQLGYGIRYFPFACRRPGRFHLRLVNLSPLQCVAAIPAAWRGTLAHPGVHDFYADRVRVTFSHAMPFQLGGDPAGHRKEVTFGLSQTPVTLIGQA
ncbi:MAG: diacylglycerol kinase [Alphaproteobacteria bacterium]|nr:diacylglycerol kinase [Alphaproteobacteria bacterium]